MSHDNFNEVLTGNPSSKVHPTYWEPVLVEPVTFKLLLPFVLQSGDLDIVTLFPARGIIVPYSPPDHNSNESKFSLSFTE